MITNRPDIGRISGFTGMGGNFQRGLDNKKIYKRELVTKEFSSCVVNLVGAYVATRLKIRILYKKNK